MEHPHGPVLAWLGHPATVVATIALPINDHLLKALWPGPVTGKLSDVAGLLVAPPLLALALSLVLALSRFTALALSRAASPSQAGSLAPFRAGSLSPALSRVGFFFPAPAPSRTGPLALARFAAPAAIVVTGLGFTLVKTTEAGAELASQVWTLLAGPSRVLADPTDLIALPALGVTWLLWRGCQTDRAVRRARALIIVPIALFGVTATSATPPPSTAKRVSLSDGVITVVRDHYFASNQKVLSYDGGLTWIVSPSPGPIYPLPTSPSPLSSPYFSGFPDSPNPAASPYFPGPSATPYFPGSPRPLSSPGFPDSPSPTASPYFPDSPGPSTSPYLPGSPSLLGAPYSPYFPDSPTPLGPLDVLPAPVTWVCVPEEPLHCYRVVPPRLGVDESWDGGATWETPWGVSEWREKELRRWSPDRAPVAWEGSQAVAVQRVAGGHVVVVANGTDGIAVRDALGTWRRLGFTSEGFSADAALPLPSPHVDLRTEHLLGFFVGLIAFMAGMAGARRHEPRVNGLAVSAYVLAPLGLVFSLPSDSPLTFLLGTACALTAAVLAATAAIQSRVPTRTWFALLVIAPCTSFAIWATFSAWESGPLDDYSTASFLACLAGGAGIGASLMVGWMTSRKRAGHPAA